MAQAVQLHQIGLFSWLQGKLEELTPEQIAAVVPGDPVPQGATVFGPMPEHLKVLLALRLSIGKEAKAHYKEAVQRIRQGDDGDQGTLDALMQKLGTQIKFIDQVIWTELRTQFPQSFAMGTIGYGPNFEAWASPGDGDGSEEDPINALLGIVALGTLLGGRVRR